jgi:hypothetical protein
MPVDVAKARELFLAALDLPAGQRAAYLDGACTGDPALRQRLEVMLQSHEHSGELLPRSPAEMLADSGVTEADATGAWRQPSDTPATLNEAPAAGPDGLPFLNPSAKPGHLGRLAHYEVQEVLGKGGFGIVLRAFDEKLHRAVAIKVLAPAYATIGSARERFIREARAAAAVKNEHVVAIYDVQDEAQPPYLVMELIDGVTLQERLDKKGPLSVKEILRIGMQTAEGLAAAHKQGLVHRDIKPANILLDNGVERVKLTDFGLARAVDDASVSQSGTVAGTPTYMSPEQAEGLAVDPRSDLFSLGSVLYAMATGHPPFRAGGTHAVLKRVIEASPRPVREVNAEIPDWLANLIAKLHAKEPGGRFQTAQEVADLLGQYLAHVQQPATVPAPAMPGVPAAAPGPPTSGLPAPVPAGGFWRRVSRILLFGAVFGVLLGVFILVFGLVPQDFPGRGWWAAYIALFGAFAMSGLIAVICAIRRNSLALTAVGLLLSGAGMVLATHFREFLGLVLQELEDRNVMGGGNPRFVPVFGGPGWRRLYDGKSYAGWKSLGNSRVGGGELVLFHGGAVETKEEMPKDFHLRMEVKLVRGHGTVRIHTPGGGEKLDGWFLRFSEAPHAPGLLASELAEVFGNAGVSTRWEGWARLGEWFYLEIITVGRRTDLRVNGQRYEHLKQVLPAAGVLRLWNNGYDDSEVAFRNIEIKDLTPAAEPGWVPLFNGNDLAGWDVKDPDNWKVQAGELIGTGLNSLLVTTKRDYRDFHLRADLQVEKGAACGIVFRGAPGDDLAFEVLHTGELERAGEPIPSSPPPHGPPPPVIPEDGVIRLEVIARRARVEVKVNGRTTVRTHDVRHRDHDRAQPIALKSRERGCAVHFRKVEIRELPPEEPGWVRLFNGKDLTGWEGDTKTWAWKNGKLVGDTLIAGGPFRNCCLFSKQRFRDFELKFRVRTHNLGGIHHGVALRCEAKAVGTSLTPHGPDVPIGKNLGGFYTLGGIGKYLKQPRDKEALADLVKIGFNDFHVSCVGKHVTITVNGLTTIDADYPDIPDEGLIAFHVLRFPEALQWQKVEFEDVQIRVFLPNSPPVSGWVQLFSGKDLSGWKTHPDHAGKWRVEKGVLVGGQPEGHLFSARGDYENFHLRFEAKVSDKGDAGIWFRSPFFADKWGPATGFFAPLNSNGASPMRTGELSANSVPNKSGYVPGKLAVTPPPDTWFTQEIIVQGNRTVIKVNGKTSVDHVMQNPPFARGHFVLTTATAKTVVQFRKIEIKELPPTEP